jgi:hypothetical protein
MLQRQLLTLLILALIAMPSFADVVKGDFKLYEEGETAVISGVKGAPLHLQYISGRLTAPLKVMITPDDSRLKLSPSTCTFTATKSDCRFLVLMKNPAAPLFGLHQFTVTEIRRAARVTSSGSTANPAPVVFGVGIQKSNMSPPLGWYSIRRQYSEENPPSTPTILVNSTASKRVYSVDLEYYNFSSEITSHFKTCDIELPENKVCYIDSAAICTDKLNYWVSTFVPSSNQRRGSYVKDITDPSDPIYNGVYKTGNNNISTCSANADDTCASGRWGSMTVALANIGSSDLTGAPYSFDNLRAWEVQVLPDNSWNSGSTIYWRDSWTGSSVALLMIQGSTDGSGFNAYDAAPTIPQIKSAAPCSSFIKDVE